MLERLKGAVRRETREPDPLVKVAGTPGRHEAQTCLETLHSRGIQAELREDSIGAFEIWAPGSVEALARFVLGLSGRSVLRIPRQRLEGAGRRR